MVSTKKEEKNTELLVLQTTIVMEKVHFGDQGWSWHHEIGQNDKSGSLWNIMVVGDLMELMHLQQKVGGTTMKFIIQQMVLKGFGVQFLIGLSKNALKFVWLVVTLFCKHY